MLTEPIEQAKVRTTWHGGRFDGHGAGLEELRDQAERERLAAIAEYERLAASADVVPGSVAELRLSDRQGYYAWWRVRNAALVDRVAAGEVTCCGACNAANYTHWCELLGRPQWTRPVNETHWSGLQLHERVEGCPVAVARRDRCEAELAWIQDFFSFVRSDDGSGDNGISFAGGHATEVLRDLVGRARE